MATVFTEIRGSPGVLSFSLSAGGNRPHFFFVIVRFGIA